MEFAKYYNVTNKLQELLNKENTLFSYQNDMYKGLFICADTHDFWICRVLEGYNEDYDKEEGKYLVEREKIDKYDFINWIECKVEKNYMVTNRKERDMTIESFNIDYIIEQLILMDDDNGVEGWDSKEADSLEKAIEMIDGGFGIIELCVR